MSIRQVIRIDEQLCDGCGLCVPGCDEGAIEIVDGKARLVSEVYCDGLGACLGHCPQGAITLIEVEAPAFDPEAVERRLRQVRPRGDAGVTAVESSCPGAGAIAPDDGRALRLVGSGPSGCPGARPETLAAGSDSELRHWPVQLHLVSPHAPYFRNADVLLAADCTAFAVGDFHRRFLSGKSLAIACPKLDQGQEIYLEKLVALFDEAEIASLTVMIMQVPCCGGLQRLAQAAAARARRRVSIRCIVVGIRGEVLAEGELQRAS